jgi:Uncharacterized Fe-S protein PflX, homolog of pyruvate formate lyase activating proteins
MADVCRICPRECGADRSSGVGYCGAGDDMYVARAMLHMWEEPCISGANGSGAVFFCGCPLRCVYCQNGEISRFDGRFGKKTSVSDLGDIILDLQDKGAHNVNFVSPTQYTYHIIEAVSNVRGKLKIPVVWNTGGYENASTVADLRGIADVYLTDFKYADAETAEKYSSAADYPEAAASSLAEMLNQAGECVIEAGLMKRGVIVRHLVLPSRRAESVRVLEKVNEIAGGTSKIKLSLMSQYTPDFADGCPYPELNRRVTSFEYNHVCEAAAKMGFTGYTQDKTSAKTTYRPDWERGTLGGFFEKNSP